MEPAQKTTVSNTKLVQSEFPPEVQPGQNMFPNHPKKIMFKKIRKYKILMENIIGRGAFSTVYLG